MALHHKSKSQQSLPKKVQDMFSTNIQIKFGKSICRAWIVRIQQFVIARVVENFFTKFSQLAQAEFKVDAIFNRVDRFFIKTTSSDFLTSGPINQAVRRKVKLIAMTFPSMQFFQSVCAMPLLSRSFQFFGFTVCYPSWHPKAIITDHIFKTNQIFLRHIKNSLVFISSFVGLEKTALMPSNSIYVGPLIQENFQVQDKQLDAWIEKQKKGGRNKFIYISLGTIVKIADDTIERIYQELKNTQYSVIWSLKKQFKYQNENFYVRKWMPQQKILRMDDVKLFITHAGWNSTTQSIYFKKPMILFPWFGDQKGNADLIVKNHMGISLVNGRPEQINQLKQMTASRLPKGQLKSAVQKIIKDPTYQEACNKIGTIGRAVKGREIIRQGILNTLQFGYEHLIDHDYNKASTRTVKRQIAKLLLLAIFIISALYFQPILKMFVQYEN